MEKITIVSVECTLVLGPFKVSNISQDEKRSDQNNTEIFTGVEVKLNYHNLQIWVNPLSPPYSYDPSFKA